MNSVTVTAGNFVDDLTTLIGNQVPVNARRKSVTLCGHFALTWMHKTFSDHLGATGDERHAFVDFCKNTLEVGCELIQSGKTNRLLVLVNDWQFLRAGTKANRWEWEKEKVRLCQEYYARTPKLPHVLLEMLYECGLSADVVERRSEHQWMFSEIELRKEFSELLRGLPSESLVLQKRLTPALDDIDVVCVKADSESIADFVDIASPIELLYGNSANCIGEIVCLLKELSLRGYNEFINIYPRECMSYVNVGTLLFEKLLGRVGMTVINVAVPTNLDISGIKIHVHKI